MKIKKSELKTYISQVLKEEASMSSNEGGIMNFLSRCEEPMRELGDEIDNLIRSLETSSLKKNIERMNINMGDVETKLNNAKSFFAAGAGMVSSERVAPQIKDPKKLDALKNFISSKMLPKLIDNTNGLISVFNMLGNQIDKKVKSRIIEKITAMDKDMAAVKYLIENPDNSGDTRQFDGNPPKIKLDTLFKSKEAMSGGGKQVQEAKIRRIIRQELKRAGY